ncbi:MAG: LysR family transcriptional regulator [Betaproteobacteria bacterium]
MPQNFDWRLIRCFLAALEHGSLLGAARALKSSQPTMGRHLAELESQLGVVLFERTGRGLKPTAMAAQLADSARAMESCALQLTRRLSLSQSSVSGSVRISASQSVACLLLPAVLAQMREHLPEIQVEVVASNAVSNLLRREADIALRMLRPEQATLIARKIGEVAMGIYGHRSYLTRRGTPQRAEDLLAHELVGDDTVDTITRAARALGHELPKTAFSLRCDDLMVQWHAVRAGYGLGFLGQYQARFEPDLQRVLPALKIAPLPLWLAVHREIRTSARIRAVYDYLAEALPELV